MLECALDRFYYADALTAVKAPGYNNTVIRDLLTLEIDVVNLRTVLRMVRDHVIPDDAARYLISGGREFDEKHLLHLVSLATIGDVVGALRDTRYRFLENIPESAMRSARWRNNTSCSKSS